MTIIVSTSEGDTTTLEETGVDSEQDLQRYIYENPECIPLDKYKDGSEVLILARELPTQNGPIDAIGVDQDAEIYVIETKLFKNQDKRRVMAQVLDYGAGLWSTYRDPDDLLERLRRNVDDKFGTGLEQKLEKAFGVDEPELDDFLSSLRTNVAEGWFRFVVLMNRIHESLKDVIRFVNRNVDSMCSGSSSPSTSTVLSTFSLRRFTAPKWRRWPMTPGEAAAGAGTAIHSSKILKAD